MDTMSKQDTTTIPNKGRDRGMCIAMEVSIKESKRKREKNQGGRTRRVDAHGHFELGSRMPVGGVVQPSSATELSTTVLPDESGRTPLLPVLLSSSTNLTAREGELSLVGGPCSARMDSSRLFLNELSAVPGRDGRAVPVPIPVEEGAVPDRAARCGPTKVTPTLPAVVGLPLGSGSMLSTPVVEFRRIEPRRRGRCITCGRCRPLILLLDERAILLLSDVEARGPGEGSLLPSEAHPSSSSSSSAMAESSAAAGCFSPSSPSCFSLVKDDLRDGDTAF